MYAESNDEGWQRLRKTVDLTGGRQREPEVQDLLRHGGGLRLRLRRGAHRRSGGLDDARGDRTSGTDGRRRRVLRHQLGHAAPVPDALPDQHVQGAASAGDGEGLRAGRHAPTPPGEWFGATGNSGGFQDWEFDLSAYKGKQVEVSISYIQDFASQGPRRVRRRRRDHEGRRGRRADVVRGRHRRVDGRAGSGRVRERRPVAAPYRGRLQGGPGRRHRRHPVLRLRLRGRSRARAAPQRPSWPTRCSYLGVLNRPATRRAAVAAATPAAGRPRRRWRPARRAGQADRHAADHRQDHGAEGQERQGAHRCPARAARTASARGRCACAAGKRTLGSKRYEVAAGKGKTPSPCG